MARIDFQICVEVASRVRFAAKPGRFTSDRFKVPFEWSSRWEAGTVGVNCI